MYPRIGCIFLFEIALTCVPVYAFGRLLEAFYGVTGWYVGVATVVTGYLMWLIPQWRKEQRESCSKRQKAASAVFFFLCILFFLLALTFNHGKAVSLAAVCSCLGGICFLIAFILQVWVEKN